MIIIKVKNQSKKVRDKKEAFNVIKQLFSRGHSEIYMCGGKIGTWR